MDVCFGIHINNSEIELEMMEAQSAAIMYQNEIHNKMHLLENNIYSEALGSLIAFGGILKAAFMLLAKFVLSFKGIILTVITGFLTFLAKRKFTGKQLDSTGGGGGGGGSSFSPSEVPVLGKPGISAESIVRRVSQIRAEKSKNRQLKVEELMSKGKISRSTFDKATAEILAEIIPQSTQAELTKEVLTNIGKDLKEQDIAKLLRIDVDGNNRGAMILGNEFLQSLVRDIVISSFEEGVTQSGRKYQDALNQAGPLVFFDAKELANLFDPIAKLLNIPMSAREVFINFTAGWIADYANIFSSAISLQYLVCGFANKNNEEVLDDKFDALDKITGDNAAFQEKMQRLMGNKQMQLEAVSKKVKKPEDTKEFLEKALQIYLLGLGTNEYKIEKAQALQPALKSIEDVIQKCFIEIKSASQLSLEVNNIREEKGYYLVDWFVGPEKNLEDCKYTKTYAVRFIKELERLKQDGDLELSQIKSVCDVLSKSSKDLADGIDKDAKIPNDFKAFTTHLLSISTALSKSLIDATTCAMKFSKMTNHPIYQLIEQEVSDVTNTLIALGIYNYADGNEK